MSGADARSSDQPAEHSPFAGSHQPTGPGRSSGRRPPRRGLRLELGGWLLPPDFYREREVNSDNWVEAVFEPAALAVLIGLFIAGLVSFGQMAAPEWDSRFVLPIALLTALAAFFYARRLARPSFLLKEWAAILLPSLMMLRFLPYLFGPDELLADAAVWWNDPLSFLGGSFIVNAALVYIAWQMGLDATLELNQLRLQPGEVVPEQLAARERDLYDTSWRFVDHATPLRRLAARVLWGGVFLVFLASLTALDIRQQLTPAALAQLLSWDRPTVSYSFANAFVYFAVGLMLLAEAQYVRQRTSWQQERLALPRRLAAGWIVQAAVATVFLVVVALLLPTEYALGISDLIGWLIAAVMLVVQFLVAIFLLVVIIITTPLRWLLPGGGGQSQSAATPPALDVPAATVIPWLDVAKSLLFWLVVLAILVYLFTVLWRRRPPLPAWAKPTVLMTLLAALGRLLIALRHWGRAAASAVVSVLSKLRPATPQALQQAGRWLSLSRLGPNQLVEYFYLSVVERAARLGVGRRAGETATEFSNRLPETLPDVEPDLSALTDAFLEVRYGRRPAEAGLVAAARARWQRLKLRMRARRVGGTRGTR